MQELTYPPLPKAEREVITLHQPTDYTEHVVTGAHYTADQMRAYAAAAIAQQAARHAEELQAYEVTVSNLRAQRVPDMQDMPADDASATYIAYTEGWNHCREAMLSAAPAPQPERKPSEAEIIISAITNPANQPSQWGTVLLPEVALESVNERIKKAVDDNSGRRPNEHWFTKLTDDRDALEAQIKAQPERKPMTFDDVAKQAIKWLCENSNPHTTLIVTPTSAELVEGVQAVQTSEFVKD